jgi:acetyl-CoA synthetase
MLLGAAGTYEELVATFRWAIPPRFNIASVCADLWAEREPERVALIGWDGRGGLTPTTYGALSLLSGRLAQALARRGVTRGDRVALLLPQSPETAIGHLAAYKLGAIAVPLAALFGEDALEYRLKASGAKALITNAAGLAKVAAIRQRVPDLAVIISTDGPDGGAEGWHQAIERETVPFPAADTRPDDPALMIFTSGTTGQPKGALHAHRVLAGHLPGFAFTHGLPPRDLAAKTGDRLWTPSDWAWAGGLLNALLPSLFVGIPVVYGPFAPFSPEAAVRLIADAGVSIAFLPPTALRMMRAAGPLLPLGLRTIGSAGESLGRETYEWARDQFGVPVNEFYGQTECNYVIGSSAALGVTRAGAIGKAIPGHRVTVLDENGRAAAPDEAGEIAVHAPDASLFLGYWNDAQATAAKFRDGWLVTGDRGAIDADGYIRFIGRNDDIITSAGYRIGPSEVEDCLATHPAVLLAAVVGKPDAVRTEIVKAYVTLRPGFTASAELAGDIQRTVRQRLSAAEYPREIAFVDEIPLTTSGKVIRRVFRERAVKESGG